MKGHKMKKLIPIIFMVLCMASIEAQTKEDNIRKLLELTNTNAIVIQVIDTLLPQYEKALPDVPKGYWDSMRENIDVNDFEKMMIALYDKYYTDEDIKQLIKFYESDIGKKMIQVMPDFTQDSFLLGQEWGKKINENILNKLKSDGIIRT